MCPAVLLTVIYLAFASLGLPDSILGAAWPSMYRPLSLPPHFAGILSMIISGGTIISSMASGALIRRLGTGRVTAFCACLTAAALAAFAVSGSFAALCAAAVPLGLGAGSVDAALNGYVALHYKARHMNWLHCCWALGASAGPLALSFILARSGSWREGYRAAALAQGVLALVLCAALPLWQKSGGRAAGVKTPGGAEAPGPARPAPPPRAAPPGAPFRDARARAMFAAFFCYCALESTAGLWGGSYMVLSRGMPPEAAARAVALFYAGICAGRFASGFLSIRLPATRVMAAGHALMAAGAALAALPAAALVRPGFFLLGLGCAPVFPGMMSLVPRLFGAARSRGVIGMGMACAYAGSALMPALAGRAAAAAGFRVIPLALGLFLALESLALLRAVRNPPPPGGADGRG